MSTFDTNRGGFRFLAGMFALAAGLLAPTAADAAPILAATSATVSPGGGAGTFDVTLTVPVGDPTLDLSAFTLEVNVPGGSGYTLTGIGVPSSGYVFAGNSFNANNGLPLEISAGPTQVLAGDASDPAASVPLTPGGTYTLGTVSFTAAPGLPLGTAVPITFGPATSLAGTAGDVAFDVGGAAQITTIPEPAALVVFGALAVVGLVAVRRPRLA